MTIRSLIAVAIFALCGHVAVAGDKPNILLICVDDLKPNLHCYGDEIVKSPNIDRLAARGIRFDAAYCNQAVCAPSRYALLTGLRPQTLGIYDLDTFFRESRPNAVTLPEHFKNNGYRTESLGKIFHRGHGNHDDAQSWSVPFWAPQARQYQLAENRAKRIQQVSTGNAKRKANRKKANGAAYENADAVDTAYTDGKTAEEAIRRLEAAAAKPNEPFFLAVGFVKPHLPFCAPKKYWDLYETSQFSLPKLQSAPEGAPEYAPTASSELRNYKGIPKQGEFPDELVRTLIHGYHACVSYTDAQIGRVLDSLEETGLADNTIVVLWGDHGWHLGDHGMWCKHTNYEQATRIPLIIALPDKTNAGQATTELVESVDIFPTLSQLASLPEPADIDGSDFSQALKNPRNKNNKAVFHVYPRGELIGRAVRTDRYRMVEWKPFGGKIEEAVYELYDYQADPEETKNLAAEQPQVLEDLKQILATQPEAEPSLRDARKAQNKSKPQQPVSS